MKQFEVVTVGSALKDIMFYSDKVFVVRNKPGKEPEKFLALGNGEKTNIKEVFVNYGGGAVNVAVGLKNFGIDVAPIINIGRDQVGMEILHHLKINKIDYSLVNIDKEHRTGFSIIVTAAKDKEHAIFIYRGASNYLNLPNLRSFRTRWFYVSALSSKDWPREFEKIAHQTKRSIRIAWNPGSVQLNDYKILIKFLPFVEILILNKDEAIELVTKNSPRTPKKQLVDPKFLLKKIQGWGAEKVVITQGARGVVAIDVHGHYYYHPSQSLEKRIVDTVGAGDAFASGLMAAMVRWENFDKGLQLGIRNSAQELYRIGAQNGLLKIKLK